MNQGSCAPTTKGWKATEGSWNARPEASDHTGLVVVVDDTQTCTGQTDLAMGPDLLCPLDAF